MLRSCRVRHFRSFTHWRWEPDAAFNTIVGPNAGGKTSVLEIVSLLTSGRSFRTALTREAIQHGQPCFSLHGTFAVPVAETVELTRCADSRKLRVNDGSVGELETLLQALPLVAIMPNTHREFLSEAGLRRRLLYWGMFHMEHSFLPRWREYSRILAQRNAQLRQLQRPTSAWDTQLIEHGQLLAELARNYIARLLPIFANMLGVLGLEDDSVALRLFCGWNDDISLSTALVEAARDDRALKRTTRGFHRADLQLSVKGVRAAAFASYGQQKTIIAALHFAQLKLLLAERPAAMLLFDDLPADWDQAMRGRALAAIAGLKPVQAFITATEAGLVPDAPGRAFHVEQGQLRAI